MNIIEALTAAKSSPGKVAAFPKDSPTMRVVFTVALPAGGYWGWTGTISPQDILSDWEVVEVGG